MDISKVLVSESMCRLILLMLVTKGSSIRHNLALVKDLVKIEMPYV